MKVLYISNKPVFPLVDGGCIAMYQFLKNLLGLGYEVRNLTIATGKHPFHREEFPEQLADIIRPKAVYADTTVRAGKAILSLFRKGSYNVDRFYEPGFESMILAELAAADYGLVILESAYLLPYLPALRRKFSGKIIVRTHNVEFQIWEQLAQAEKGFLKRIFLRKLAKDLKAFELSNLQKVDGIAAISEADALQFKKLGIRVPVTVIPASMDIPENLSADYTSNDLFFLGSMNWKPNIEAVEWLLKDIFPEILARNPQVKLHLAGSFMSEKLRNREQENVIIHGKVPRVKEFMAAHGTLIVPMKSGSGIRIKILEALSLGVPVISTATGLEGIPFTDGVHCVLADTKEQLIERATEILRDPEKRRITGTAGKELIEAHYSPSNLEKKLREFIGNI